MKAKSHGSKAKLVHRAIRTAVAKILFLPPYSPDLIPIEYVLASSKPSSKKSDEKTVEDTWKRIGEFLDCFTPDKCANYIPNSRHASIKMDHAIEYRRLWIWVNGKRRRREP